MPASWMISDRDVWPDGLSEGRGPLTSWTSEESAPITDVGRRQRQKPTAFRTAPVEAIQDSPPILPIAPMGSAAPPRDLFAGPSHPS